MNTLVHKRGPNGGPIGRPLHSSDEAGCAAYIRNQDDPSAYIQVTPEDSQAAVEADSPQAPDAAPDAQPDAPAATPDDTQADAQPGA